MEYGLVLEKVRNALNDDTVYNLAVAYTGERDGALVEQIVADQYQGAIEGANDFNWTVEEYLFQVLDSEVGAEKMKAAETFETAAAAEKEGFYWDDTIDRWLKL